MSSLQRSAALQGHFRKFIDGSHILHLHQVVDAYGHLSFRHPFRPDTFVMSFNIAPAQVSSPEDLIAYRVEDAEPVQEKALPGFAERRIHSEIYKRHPEVNAVVHSHSEAVVPYTISGVPLRDVSHMCGFLGPDGLPVFDAADHMQRDDHPDLLVRTEAMGAALARHFDDGNNVTLMRGHGFTVVADRIELAVMRAVYTQKNAGIQTTALMLQGVTGTAGGGVKGLSKEECAGSDQTTRWSMMRPWNLWGNDDLSIQLLEPGTPLHPGSVIRGRIVRKREIAAPLATVCVRLLGRAKAKLAVSDGDNGMIYYRSRFNFWSGSAIVDVVHEGPIDVAPGDGNSQSWPFTLALPTHTDAGLVNASEEDNASEACFLRPPGAAEAAAGVPAQPLPGTFHYDHPGSSKQWQGFVEYWIQAELVEHGKSKVVLAVMGVQVDARGRFTSAARHRLSCSTTIYPTVLPTFTTYCVKIAHALYWEVQISVAGEVWRGQGNQEILLLPPCEDASGSAAFPPPFYEEPPAGDESSESAMVFEGGFGLMATVASSD
ncbi:Decarboxylase tropJ [Colletotrichum shisoi]|uniref:Decarboxylase tropJ n=1 Tax=Colletotrichum shisoi TaxID=2078593 RepID=A0A5Q4BIK5_9PEZI|nr:Decarboxylase tropJ [Colletotrichum shisoi]